MSVEMVRDIVVIVVLTPVCAAVAIGVLYLLALLASLAASAVRVVLAHAACLLTGHRHSGNLGVPVTRVFCRRCSRRFVPGPRDKVALTTCEACGSRTPVDGASFCGYQTMCPECAKQWAQFGPTPGLHSTYSQTQTGV